VPCLAQQPATLHGCDALDGARLDLGSNWDISGLEVVTDPGFPVEGAGALRLYGTSPAGHDGNSYLSARVTIPPTDFGGQALVFDAASSTPAESQALYVRGFDAEGTCVMSWTSWNGQLKAEMQSFTLHPRLPGGGIAWEPDFVKSDDLSAVTSFVFFTGTHNAGVEFNMVLDNIRIEKSTRKTFMDVTEPKPLYPDTTLVEDGEARAIIVAPQAPEWGAVAADVASAIEEATGVALPIVTADEVTDAQLAETNAIVIGASPTTWRCCIPTRTSSPSPTAPIRAMAAMRCARSPIRGAPAAISSRSAHRTSRARRRGLRR